jgi:hypothetical protein
MDAEADLLGSATDVAVTIVCMGEETLDGAVYVALFVPVSAIVPQLPEEHDTLQVTAGSGVLLTVAVRLTL